MFSFQDTINDMNRIINDAKFEAKQAFSAQLARIFKIHPDINTIQWRQFTPYFNDGDTCEFSIDEIFITGHDNEDLDWSNYEEISVVSDFIESSLGYALMEELYGTNVAITVTKDGISTESYDPGLLRLT